MSRAGDDVAGRATGIAVAVAGVAVEWGVSGHDDTVGDRRVPRSTWPLIGRSAISRFQRHGATRLAAALTYYAVFALFPGLVALVSLLGVFGNDSTTDSVLRLIEDLGQSDVAETLEEPIHQIVGSRAAGFTLVLGLAGALWSASGYVGSFGAALNMIYDVREGRPLWMRRLVQLVITAVLVALAAVVLIGLVVSGPFARELGARIGAGDTTVRVWNWGKWPVLLLIVVVIVALLYSLTPNVRRPIRPFSTGALLAIVVWVLASVGFGFYVSNFGSYNATYGSLAGVIVFLLWLWLTNVALLLGAEVDAEVERIRQLRAGLPAAETLQLPPRDERAIDQQDQRYAELVAARRAVRDEALAQRERAAGGPEAADARPSAVTPSAVDGSAPSTTKVLAQAAGVGLLSAVVGALAGLMGVDDRHDR
ncbi:MAG: YihY/virulence factor BrkB family protein [Desertimonas sp.]